MKMLAGRIYFALTHSTDKRAQNKRFLCAVVKWKELKEIDEKFRYETGVVPIIILT